MSEHIVDANKMITPGPWEPVRSLTCGHLRAAHNYHTDPHQEWTDADIRLIASAPLMFRIIERLEPIVNDYNFRCSPDGKVLADNINRLIAAQKSESK